MTGNGQQEEKPTLKIVFDPATQSVAMEFDTKEVKTWEFILGLLEMARNYAEFRLAVKRAENMQQQAQQQMQDQMLAQKMMQGPGKILRGN